MIPLKQIRVETPCGADWEQMEGSEKVRFCAACRKNVLNLSAMTRAEAAWALAGLEGVPCVRFHHDAIGAPLTREELPTRRRFLGHLAGLLLALIGATFARPIYASEPVAPGQAFPARPTPPGAFGKSVGMGGMAVGPPPAALTGEVAALRPLMGKVRAPARHPRPVTPTHHPSGRRSKG